MKEKNFFGQSILEYAILVMILISALFVGGLYYKRSLQGRYRQAADVLGEGSQYSPP